MLHVVSLLVIIIIIVREGVEERCCCCLCFWVCVDDSQQLLMAATDCFVHWGTVVLVEAARVATSLQQGLDDLRDVKDVVGQTLHTSLMHLNASIEACPVHWGVANVVFSPYVLC